MKDWSAAESVLKRPIQPKSWKVRHPVLLNRRNMLDNPRTITLKFDALVMSLPVIHNFRLRPTINSNYGSNRRRKELPFKERQSSIDTFRCRRFRQYLKACDIGVGRPPIDINHPLNTILTFGNLK